MTNLLANRDFRAYYLDHMEYLLDTEFTPEAFAALIGDDGDGGLWQRVSQAAYLESGAPSRAPFTGRQWTNDEVWRSGCRQQELRHGNRARAQDGAGATCACAATAPARSSPGCAEPAGGHGEGHFPAALEPLPARA